LERLKNISAFLYSPDPVWSIVLSCFACHELRVCLFLVSRLLIDILVSLGLSQFNILNSVEVRIVAFRSMATATSSSVVAASASSPDESFVYDEVYTKSIDKDGSLHRSIMALPIDKNNIISQFHRIYFTSSHHQQHQSLFHWCWRCFLAPVSHSTQACTILQRLIQSNIPHLKISTNINALTLFQWAASLPDRLPLLTILINTINNKALSSHTNSLDALNSMTHTELSTRRRTVMHHAASFGFVDNLRTLATIGHLPIDEPSLTTIDILTGLKLITTAENNNDTTDTKIDDQYYGWFRFVKPTPVIFETPLYLAMLSGARGVVDWLIDTGGVSLLHKKRKGITAAGSQLYMASMLHLVARSPNLIHLIPLLLSTGDYNIDEHMISNLNTPLHEASIYGNLEGVKLLVEFKASLSSRNKWGDMALHMAADRNHVNIIEYIFSNHPPLPSSDSSDTILELRGANEATPLWRACAHNSNTVVQFLIDHKANIMSTDRNGHTCVMAAASSGYIQPIRLLLHAALTSSSAPSSIRNNDRRTNLNYRTLLCALDDDKKSALAHAATVRYHAPSLHVVTELVALGAPV
jgi:ankyrin repeat protein